MGRMSAFSTTSANSFPSAPTVCSAIARMPASGPTPKVHTRISAYTMSGTVRNNSSRRRNTKCAARFGARLAAAGKHSSSATAAPPSVARAAIWLVSNSSHSQLSSRYIQ